MTPEEKQLLTDLANKIAQTPAPQRDAEAEDFIRTHIGTRPDALYLMTQTVLIQNMALDHANQEIAQLRQEQAQSPGRPAGGSFLGGAPAGQPQYHEQPMQPQYPQYSQQPQQPQYAPQPPTQGGGSSFLASAAKTVAGVAAGALAFEGIRSLFHSGSGGGGGIGFPGGGSGFLGGGAAGLMGSRPGETVINNYYDNPSDSADRALDDQAVDDQADDDQADDLTDGDDQNYDDQAVDDSSDYSDSGDNSDSLT